MPYSATLPTRTLGRFANWSLRTPAKRECLQPGGADAPLGPKHGADGSRGFRFSAVFDGLQVMAKCDWPVNVMRVAVTTSSWLLGHLEPCRSLPTPQCRGRSEGWHKKPCLQVTGAGTTGTRRGDRTQTGGVDASWMFD